MRKDTSEYQCDRCRATQTFEDESPDEIKQVLNRIGWKKIAYGFISPTDTDAVVAAQHRDLCGECAVLVADLIRNPQLSISQTSVDEVK